MLGGTYRPTRRRKDFQDPDAHKEKLEEDYHLLHRQPTASPDNRRQSIFTSRDTLDRFVAPAVHKQPDTHNV